MLQFMYLERKMKGHMEVFKRPRDQTLHPCESYRSLVKDSKSKLYLKYVVSLCDQAVGTSNVDDTGYAADTLMPSISGSVHEHYHKMMQLDINQLETNPGITLDLEQ